MSLFNTNVTELARRSFGEIQKLAWNQDTWHIEGTGQVLRYALNFGHFIRKQKG